MDEFGKHRENGFLFITNNKDAKYCNILKIYNRD